MSTNNAAYPRWAPLAAYLAVCILWGSTYMAIGVAVRTIPPLVMMAMRFIAAGSILMIWCLAKGERLPGAKTFIQSAITGLLLLFIGNTTVAIAERHLATGLTAIIVAALPLWMVILDKAHWKDSFRSIKVIAGLGLGFAGVVFLVTAGGGSVHFSLHNKAQLICLVTLIIGSAAWAAGSLYSKYNPVPGSTLIKVSLQMLTAGVALLIAATLTGDLSGMAWGSVSGASWEGLAYLVTFGSLVGYLSYIWVLGVWPASRVGTYAYINPIVAVFLGCLFLEEALTLGQFIGLGIILAGVMLVNSQKK